MLNKNRIKSYQIAPTHPYPNPRTSNPTHELVLFIVKLAEFVLFIFHEHATPGLIRTLHPGVHLRLERNNDSTHNDPWQHSALKECLPARALESHG